MLKITVVQPSNFPGENPDDKAAQFLMGELEKTSAGALWSLRQTDKFSQIWEKILVPSVCLSIPRKSMCEQQDLVVEWSGMTISFQTDFARRHLSSKK